ncbi:hypothetical protein [Candidatus Williamhamiltonella defendens]|uniref:hypothetical protein n=1 Tax=Candidatus Williamhamiltonella defendens TaxID=138072 RepID=UPI001F388166|nr:hypothetical protein [Candidatus Hamiltonella defensa]
MLLISRAVFGIQLILRGRQCLGRFIGVFDDNNRGDVFLANRYRLPVSMEVARVFISDGATRLIFGGAVERQA